MKTWKRISSVSLSLLLFITFIGRVYGQRVDTYTIEEFDGVFVDISPVGTSTGIPFTYVDDGGGWGVTDEGIGLITLPFDFPYDGDVVTQGSVINASTNGCIVLRPLPYAAGSNGGFAAPYMGAPGRAGVIMWALIDAGVVSSTDYYEVDGTAPNRVLTIQQNAAEIRSNTTVQTKLYESSGNIEFLYLHHGIPDNNGGGAAIGLQGWNIPTPDYISYYPLDTLYGWSTVQTLPTRDLRWIRHIPPPSELSLEPSTLNFGALLPGQIDTLCVTAQSLGPAALKLTGADLCCDPQFSLISDPTNDSIPVGESRQYCFQFVAPNTLGARSAVFILRTNGRDSGTQTVTLTGAAILPAVQYGATSLFHRLNVKLGDSATQYIPVTSSGTSPLTFNSISIIGLNSDNYYVSRYPQNTLPAGMSDSIGITFTPMIEGRPDASVIINSNALNIPRDSISLFGVGILPHLVVTPSHGSHTTLSFDSVSLGDSVCETIALMNPGTDTLRLKGQFESGDPDFTFYPLMGSDTMLLPNQTKLVDVCFKPLQRGTRLASVRFYTNIQLTYDHPRRDTSQFSVNIVATGVPSGQLILTGPFGDSAEIGKPICVIDTLQNIGSADVTVTGATITGTNASEFVLSGVEPLPFTLSSGQKKVVTLCFTPQGRGIRTANISVAGTTADRLLTEVFPLLGYGLEVCASANPTPATFGSSGKTLVGRMDTTVITITNCGDVATTYTATASPSNYTIVGSSTSGSVAPNGTASYTVVFAPTAIGVVAGTLSFTGSLPASVPLNGIGAGVTATATGSAGSVGKGACQNFDVTITNTGNVDWNAGTPTIAGTNAADYTIVSGPTPNPIPAGGTATVTIKFCPSIVGSETATLTFPSGSPSPIGGFSYALTGTGVVNGVSEKASDQGFELGQSYPNPTNGSAVVMFTLPTDAPVRIDLIDAKGSIVHTVFTGRMTSGDHSVTLDAKDLASGTYFYTLTSGDIHLTRQMILVR